LRNRNDILLLSVVYSLSYEDAEFPANTGQIQGITGVDESGAMVRSRKLFTRAHSETPEETCSFRFGKEGFFAPAMKSRACAEAYMGTPHKKARRLTPPGRKRTLSGRKLTPGP